MIPQHVRRKRKRRYVTGGRPPCVACWSLRDRGAIPPPEQPQRWLRAPPRVSRFWRRSGLASATIYNYARHIDRFLSGRFRTGRCASRLHACDVTAFVQRNARERPGTCLQVVTGVRSFLRFARYRGYIETDLGSAIPRVANWKLAGLPKYLPRGAARQVLAHCGQTTATGRRNYAILMLPARLGLRGGEVVDVGLEDIDWRKGEITVRSKKGGGWVRFPLPADVGQAIAGYLEQGRPRCANRNVFVRIQAPHRPFASSGVVSVLVRTALDQAGVKSARKGRSRFPPHARDGPVETRSFAR